MTGLVSGAVEHHNSLGTRVTVRPGELNHMAALPSRFMGIDLKFERYAPTPAEPPGARVRVFLGALA